jgi:predicted MFS family arabinose efflux permease
MIFRAYVLCIFTMVFCVNDPAPLFELFRRADGLSPSELSMLYAVYAGVVIVTLPVFGRASDRFGRRSLVVFGLSFIVVGSLILAVAGSFASLVGGRLLQGLGVAAMSAPAASALAELAGAQRQAATASIIAVALAVGGASAPLFSGVAAETLPAFPTASLIFCAGMALASLISVALCPDPWRLPQPGIMLSALQRAFVAADPGLSDTTEGAVISNDSGRIAFWQACVAVVVCFGAQATFFTVTGPMFGTLLTSHVLLAAGCAMFALMVASGLGAMLASRLGATAAMASGMALVIPGVCGFFELVGIVPVLALTPAIAAIGLGHGLGYAGAMRLINETAHSTRRASYTSKFYVAMYIGGGLPVVGRGVLEELIGRAAASAVFSLVIAVLAIGVLTSLRLTARSRHPSAEPPVELALAIPDQRTIVTHEIGPSELSN